MIPSRDSKGAAGMSGSVRDSKEAAGVIVSCDLTEAAAVAGVRDSVP